DGELAQGRRALPVLCAEAVVRLSRHHGGRGAARARAASHARDRQRKEFRRRIPHCAGCERHRWTVGRGGDWRGVAYETRGALRRGHQGHARGQAGGVDDAGVELHADVRCAAGVRDRWRVQSCELGHTRGAVRAGCTAGRDAGAGRRFGDAYVKAITFAAPIPRYLATLAAGRVSDRFYLGALACTRYGDVDDPALPSERWVRIRTRLGGICGSDLNVITLKASPSTSPFSSFPFVLGHENVGEIIEVGRGVRAHATGERVTVNPLLCCEPRGVFPPCDACAAGDHSRCAHFTDGDLAPGMLIGTTRGVGGSWGEQFVAHVSQLVRVDDRMSDRDAVLV